MNRIAHRRWRQRLTTALLGLALITANAQAHLLKVFAYAEGQQLHGNAYFTGGDPAIGATIEIRSGDDRLLTSLSADTQGEFSVSLVSLVDPDSDLTVIADSGDGHRAEWLIGASELGSVLDAESVERSATYASASATASTATDIELLALVERAVARQVGPLRRELQASQQRARLGDILGGIGLIFGLTGTLLWWRSRRTTRP
ncbi:hypothetical protein [Motiliproteus sediminis]|uniref:hypothetical protein n=1 Tax=Motiliproteus sediminis TaxID=1468178 RepID=UPI001AEFF0C4|nr:hypothetical protein [Motiliproteus sediminis]